MSGQSDAAQLRQVIDRATTAYHGTGTLSRVSLGEWAICLLLLDIRDNLDRLVVFHTGGVPAHHEADHFRALEERLKNADQTENRLVDQGVKS